MEGVKLSTQLWLPSRGPQQKFQRIRSGPQRAANFWALPPHQIRPPLYPRYLQTAGYHNHELCQELPLGRESWKVVGPRFNKHFSIARKHTRRAPFRRIITEVSPSKGTIIKNLKAGRNRRFSNTFPARRSEHVPQQQASFIRTTTALSFS
jgi:hypothetical protein